MVAEIETKAETETKAAAATPKPKRRPIVRLGIVLISHSTLFSVVCCVAGVLALFLLPVLAKNTYISENALMPGSARSMLSSREVSVAGRLLEDIASLNLKSASTGIESKRLIAQYMSNLGAEVSYHKFHPQSNKFHPLQFFSSPDSGVFQDNISCSAHGINVVGIVRAPRGDGKESIIIVTPYDSVKNGPYDNLSLAIAYSVFSLLSEVTWLAKDIIWLVADSQYGEYASVSSWLKDYHTSVSGGLGMPNPEMCWENSIPSELKENLFTDTKVSSGGFKRAGTMAAAFVIKVAKRNEQYEDTLSIYAEASNGQMPNLDLINIVNYLAVHGQGLRVKVENSRSLLESKWLRVLGEVFESVGKIARSINPQWKFGIPAADYVDGSATLASSLYYQALGVPTGSHGAFRDYQVDAITLEISPSRVKRNEFLLRSGRLIEGVIRSVNNLLEKFHQSFFLYLLTSPSKFVSVGVYMIAFALLIAPLPLVAASLYFDANELKPSLENDKPTPDAAAANTDKLENTLRSWKWLKAAKQVSAIHLWGTIVSFLPYFIYQIPTCTPTTSFMIWFMLSLVSLMLVYFILGSQLFQANSAEPQKEDWAILKSVTISAAFIGLALMSVINFATAEIGALLMTPMCMLARPLILEVRAKSVGSILRAVCSLALGVIGFPPVAFILFKGVCTGFSSPDVGDFWAWVESLWLWNSATYLYIGMVHLPCWVLCVHILLYPVDTR